MEQDPLWQPTHKGDFPSKEPIDPFLDSPPLENTGEKFHLKAPQEPLTKKNLIVFLNELERLVFHIQELRRTDQHRIAEELQQVKHLLHSSDLPKEAVREFEKLTGNFNALLIHSAPLDQEGVMKEIKSVLHALE